MDLQGAPPASPGLAGEGGEASFSSSVANIAHLLTQVPFLRRVPEEELRPLADQSVVRRCKQGESVVKQGEFGHSMFVLLSGGLSVHAFTEEGVKLHLGKLERPGDFFGEVALLGRGTRSATVVTDEETVLLEIEKNRFDRFARTQKQAVEELETFYHSRAITTYMRLHRYLGQLEPDALAQLTVGAVMKKFNRDEVVFRQGDPSDSVLLLKDGVLKMVRRSAAAGGGTSILAYFNTHDVVGAHDSLAGRSADLVTLGQAEVIYVKRSSFDALAEAGPEIYARFGKDDMNRQEAMSKAGATVMMAVNDFLQEGVEVESLLVINLDRCVRCGNCVRSCHDRHEFTRLDRRGPIFKRRVSVESTQHEHLLMPSSCRHCRDPECMIGCPTGAIFRTKDGEVDINDNCIGCENCARKCPYGNITMMPLPEDQQKDGITKKAIKCNMCKGYAYSNCVYNCPRGAVLRVDPLRYFDELQMVMEAEALEGLKWQRETAESEGRLKGKQRLVPRSTTFIPISLGAFAVALLGLVLLYVSSPGPHVGGSRVGLMFGGAATTFLFAATLLGARKRLRNVALGNLEVWTQVHMLLGGLGFVSALMHSGFRLTGVLTTLLALVFAFEVLTGVVGQAIYMVVPRILTRLERGGLAKLVEDLLEENLELEKGTRELIEKSPADIRAFVEGPLHVAARPVRARFARRYEPAARLADIKKELAGVVGRLPLREHATAERLIVSVVRDRDVRAQLLLHRSMKVWLTCHLATTGMLITFALAHILTILPFVM
jgi:Fe-S-cluster-containing dehydrogenase component